ncbi:MAG: PKD domain-containing protein, partial [Planctomycetota bacterium]
TIDFSVTASDVNGHDLTYDWDFGDGASDTGPDVTHTYAGSGDYTATVTVDDGFDPVEATVDVRVNTPPVIDTGPGASPTLVEIGETVTFGTAASDANGDAVTFNWDFGDTTSASGDSATHGFGTDGTFTVTLTVSDGLDEVTGTVDVTVAKPVGIAKFKGKLNFKKQNKDAFLFKGDLELPQDFTPGGKSFQLDVGGATATFTMDEKGKAKTDTGKLKLKFNKKKGLWSFKLKLKKSSLADEWADEGLVNSDVAGVEVKLRTVLTVDGTIFIKTTTVTYKGKAGKSGKVK